MKHGDLFDGRYRIERLLGSGGMADVYLARDEELGRQVAIKILYERFLDDDSFLERFRREAQAAAGLSHPNIVQIYDRRESQDGLPYIAMEVVPGRDLREVEVALGLLDPEQAVAYATQILAALACAHRAGIVHRDIKPQNVLVGDDGRVRVTDFGIARSASSELTEDGALVGTASYMSPEQAQGQPVGPASDLYSVGVVVYEMLTGRTPFEGAQPVQVALKHINEAPPPLRELQPGLAPALAGAVLRALAKDPAERYPDAQSFAAALADALQQAEATMVLPASAPRAAPAAYREPPYAAPYPSRRRLGPPLLAGLGLAAVAGLALVLLLGRHGDSGPSAAKAGAISTRPKTTPQGQVKRLVPALIGLKQARAVALVKRQHLEAQVTSAPSDQPAGVVFKQSPQPATQLEPGAAVQLTVSAGRPQTQVPDVQGQPYAQAAKALASAKLKPSRFDVYSSQPQGQVVAQHPAPGQSLAVGQTVRLNVSKGKGTVTLPDLVGQDSQSAVQQLTGQGVNVHVVAVPSSQPKGQIVAQNPAAGSQVKKGSQVRLNVSSGPPPTTTSATTTTPPPTTTRPTTTPAPPTVPDVTGEDQDQAAQDLRGAGFNVWVNHQTTQDPSEDGVVLDQNPQGDTQAKRGQTVYITVGQYQSSP